MYYSFSTIQHAICLPVEAWRLGPEFARNHGAVITFEHLVNIPLIIVVSPTTFIEFYIINFISSIFILDKTIPYLLVASGNRRI